LDRNPTISGQGWSAEVIISAAPFRVSFAGGGSDLPVFWRRRRGAVLSATIDKHVYISVHPYFNRSQTLLKYSANELVGSVEEIRHPILRECLRALWPGPEAIDFRCGRSLQ
jgi:D-glycero-alpha-D-manno-heptose-7-phosphate kinase